MRTYVAIGIVALLAGCDAPQLQKVDTHIGQPIAITYSARSDRLDRLTVVLQNGQNQELVTIEANDCQLNGEEITTTGLASILKAERDDGDNDMIQIRKLEYSMSTRYAVKTGIKPEVKKTATEITPELEKSVEAQK